MSCMLTLLWLLYYWSVLCVCVCEREIAMCTCVHMCVLCIKLATRLIAKATNCAEGMVGGVFSYVCSLSAMQLLQPADVPVCTMRRVLLSQYVGVPIHIETTWRGKPWHRPSCTLTYLYVHVNAMYTIEWDAFSRNNYFAMQLYNLIGKKVS